MRKMKRITAIFTIGALVGIFLALFHPVNSTLHRLVLVVSIGVCWSGLTNLLWNQKRVRCLFLLLPLLVAIPFVLPARDIDTAVLREDYVRRLNAFEGDDYYWGGESSRGIDCSGLPRRAFRDALLSYGLRNLNGKACRAFLEQWWFDASAKALGEGYRSYTVPVGVSGTIEKMDYGDLMPGDIAVTSSGIHALAYAGEDDWIQAEPGIGKVVTLDGRKSQNLWFGRPVIAHRWRILDERNVSR